MNPADLKRRRDRIQRIEARRPEPVTVEVTVRPGTSSARRENLIALLFDLLESRRHSGAR